MGTKGIEIVGAKSIKVVDNQFASSPSLPPLPEELRKEIGEYLKFLNHLEAAKHVPQKFSQWLLFRGWGIVREEGSGDCVRCNGTGQTIHPCPLCMGTGDRKKGEVCTKNDFQDTWNMKIPAPKEEVPRADAEEEAEDRAED